MYCVKLSSRVLEDGADEFDDDTDDAGRQDRSSCTAHEPWEDEGSPSKVAGLVGNVVASDAKWRKSSNRGASCSFRNPLHAYNYEHRLKEKERDHSQSRTKTFPVLIVEKFQRNLIAVDEFKFFLNEHFQGVPRIIVRGRDDASVERGHG